MQICVRVLLRRAALLVASAAAVLLTVDTAAAQYPIGGGYPPIGRGPVGGNFPPAGRGIPGANVPGAGVPGGVAGMAPAGSARRFYLTPSVTGTGPLYTPLDPVSQFGQALNSGQAGNGGGYPGSGGYAGANLQGGSLGSATTLLRQPPGVLMNAMFNGSTSYGIYGNQPSTSYQGSSPQQYGGGGYGSPYGGGYPGGGFPGKGFPGNGGYGY